MTSPPSSRHERKHRPGPGRTLVVNLFRLRPGIAPERFVEFSSTVDQPRCAAHSDVVTRFDAYMVGGATAAALGADVVEVMEVTDWQSWVELRDNDPSLAAVLAGFSALVDPASVRSSFVTPIPRG